MEAVFGVGDDGKGGKGGKGKRQKGMDSTAFTGNDGCMGVWGGGRLFTALRFVHGYRETSVEIEERQERQKAEKA